MIIPEYLEKMSEEEFRNHMQNYMRQNFSTNEISKAMTSKKSLI